MREYELTTTSTRFNKSKTIQIELEPIKLSKIKDFENDKEFEKYIKKLERIVRNSIEYKNYITYLRDYRDMKYCSFYNNINKSELKYFPIEQHHSPITLFTICFVVAKQYFDTKGYYNTYAICNAVNKLHYKGLIGLIPLSVTIHKLVHTGDIFIPTINPFGQWENFIEQYKPYFTDDQLNNLNFKISLTNDILNGQIEYSCPILDEEIIYLDMKGYSLNLPLMDLEIKKQIEIKDKLVA